ncbi:MAG: anthranilate phosphoribosyltransferase, partial [Actinobacteria bacterium]|nr:anthranilate phosphoribosyltransferase [Actinomycetota bacterium]
MGSLLRGEQSPEQIKQFLLGYNAREATPDELGGFLSAVREAATRVELPDAIASQ